MISEWQVFNLNKGAEANNDLGEPNGLEDSAVDHFQQLRAENDPVEQRPPWRRSSDHN